MDLFAKFFSEVLYLLHRLIAAIFTIPGTGAWLYAATLLLILTVISLPIGFQRGFLQVDVVNTSRETIIGIIAVCLLTPAISEELFFRVLLLPHPSESASILNQLLWGGISLILFIIYHPLNALTFYPSGLRTFFNPVFLFLAALLGVVCTLTYWQSGSLWPPVVIHWLVVVVWLLVLGGYRKLNT